LDFYANARLYEIRGDFLNARRSYLGYFNFALPYVDPHLRFQTFLRVQEGRVGAREVYQELVSQKPDDPVRPFALALLYDPPERVTRLEAYIAEHPDFAPAYYELSRDFSQARLGSQTLADKRREQELLTRFLALDEQGALLASTIDQTVAAEQLEDARTRLAALGALPGAMAENPVDFNAMRSNQGWTFTFSIPEAAREIFVAMDGGPFESTGPSPNIDQRTGAPAPMPFISAQGDIGAQTVSMKYVDANGVEQGPYEFAFDPVSEVVEGAIASVKMSEASWVYFREDPDYPFTYFTSLITGACGLREIRYGWDDETPDTVHPLPACDLRNPGAVADSAVTYIPTPPKARAMYVQVTYADGTTSDVERFTVPR
jgi:hypothetical protein